jgi:transposase
MPPKGKTTRPQSQIDEAVKRFMNGEQAVVLAKHYKISKPGFYLWVKKYKEELLRTSKTGDMTPHQAELSDKRTLIAEVQALKLENQKLRNKVVSLMIKSGEM